MPVCPVLLLLCQPWRMHAMSQVAPFGPFLMHLLRQFMLLPFDMVTSWLYNIMRRGGQD